MPRRVLTKITLGLVVVAGSVAAMGLWAWMTYRDMEGFADAIGCDTHIRGEIPSPSNRHRAVIYQRICGATTGFNTQLSVVPVGAKFQVKRYPAVAVVDQNNGIRARWLSDSQLEVLISSGAKVYRKEVVADGVSVVYIEGQTTVGSPMN